MYDLDQTISCSILRQKEIFDQLASFGNKVSSKRKKISDHKKSTQNYFFAVIYKTLYVGLHHVVFSQTMFASLVTLCWDKCNIK